MRESLIPRPARIASTIVMALLAIAGQSLADSADPGPAFSMTAGSESGIYEITLSTEDGDKPPIGVMHRWTIKVLTKEGEAVYPAQISVGGGMQGHGHGLPTQPQVIAYGGDGIYLVDGVRFNMEGKWQLSFIIVSDYGFDRVNFDVDVEF